MSMPRAGGGLRGTVCRRRRTPLQVPPLDFSKDSHYSSQALVALPDIRPCHGGRMRVKSANESKVSSDSAPFEGFEIK